MSSRAHRLAGTVAALLFVFGLLLEVRPSSSSTSATPDSDRIVAAAF